MDAIALASSGLMDARLKVIERPREPAINRAEGEDEKL